MKILSKIIIGFVGLVAFSLSSCNYLDVDKYFEDTFREDSIFHSQKNAEGYLWNTPKDFPDPGALWALPWTPGQLASDEIATRWRTNQYIGSYFTTGEINSRFLGSFNIWYRMYRIINRCNVMLENVDGVVDMNSQDKQLYKGYVHFLRGYAYYHLLMNFGPLLIIGDEVMLTSEPASYYDRERATYDESIEYVCNEFALAARVLPTSAQQSINFYERPTKGAALGLISRLRLYHASPLFNGGDAARRSFGNWKRKSDGEFYVSQTYHPERWAIAAAAAKSVIEMGLYSLHTVENDNVSPYPLAPNVSTDPFPDGAGGIDPYHSFADMFNGESIIQTNPEFIWAMPSGGTGVTGSTRYSFPVYFGGWGGLAVPQRVVDAFYMADGRTIRDASAEYPYDSDLHNTIGQNKSLGSYQLMSNVPKMYDNREARFYASIGFPGAYWPMNSASQDANFSKKQIWFSADDPSGISGTGANINDYNVTGYTPIKYIHPDDSYANGKGSVTTAFVTNPKPFPIIRYAEILLEYAEALNNVEGEVTVNTINSFGMEETVTVSRDVNEISKYFNMVRFRAGLPGVTEEQLSSKEEFQKVLMNERQVELFNEGYRYFDTRRWGIYLDEDANTSNWRGLNVERDRNPQSPNTGFWEIVTINTQNVRDRIAKPSMVLLPLPHSELMKVPSMDQNPGWDR